MATVIVGCILCSTCESSKKQKNLYGPSFGDVLHVLQSLAAVHGVELLVVMSHVLRCICCSNPIHVLHQQD